MSYKKKLCQYQTEPLDSVMKDVEKMSNEVIHEKLQYDSVTELVPPFPEAQRILSVFRGIFHGLKVLCSGYICFDTSILIFMLTIP